MQFTDTLTKSFLTSSTSDRTVAGLSRWGKNQDPTYMGFWVYFAAPTPNSAFNDQDYLPQGLFLPDGPRNTVAYSDSAVSYLKRRNEFYRAAQIQEFQQGFLYVANNTPWMFNKITGLADLWKIDPTKPYRTKEVNIVLECVDSIDMKMTYLIDLYRKAAFDAAFHRYILPDCQRMFSMEIVIAEIRTMQTANPNISNIGGNTPLSLGSFLRFQLDYCEFDFFMSESLSYLGDVENAYHQNFAKLKIPIKVGRVTEVNSYGLLGAVLYDTRYHHTRTNSFKRTAFTNNTTQTDATGENVERAINDYFPLRGEFNNFEDGQRAYARANQERDNTRQNSLFGGGSGDKFGTGRPAYRAPLNPLLAGALAALNNAVNTAANSAILGNVYGFSAANLANTLQGLLNNPVGVTQGLLADNGVNQETSSTISQNIGLTGVEIQLVKNLIGIANDIQNVVAGTELQNATLGEIGSLVNASANLQGGPENIGLQGNNISIQGNPANAGLTGAGAVSTPGGRVELNAPEKSTRIDPIAIALSSPGASLDGTTGKVVFTSASSTLNGQGGNVNLIPPPQNTGSVSKVDLIAPNVPSGSLENVELTGPPTSSLVEKQTPLTGTGALEGNPGNANLESTNASLNGRASKEELKGTGSIQGDVQKVDLSGPTTPPAFPGKVELAGPSSDTKLKETNINLESPPTNRNNPGRVELE